MKINLFLNDYSIDYRSNSTKTKTLNNIPLELVRKIYRPEHQYVLRGEPTEHPKFREILDVFTEKNYILMTEASNLNALIGYKNEIPYISFCYDGFQNDQMRGNRNLTYNLIKSLDYFSGKNTQMRIEYIVSSFNHDWFDVDMLILKKFMNQYPKMKQPYFVLYQECDYFKNREFTWVPITHNDINSANSMGLLTQKNLDFLNAYMNRKDYACTSLKDELIILPDGTVRTCLSHKINNIIADVKTTSLEDVISATQEIRENAVGCEFKLSCWLAYHYKESIFQIEEQKRASIEKGLSL